MPSVCPACPSFAAPLSLTSAPRGAPSVTRRARGPVCVTAAPRRARPAPDPARPSRGLAIDISSAAEFVSLQAAAAAAERVVYVLFHAGYCRACKAVLPKFRAVASQYPNATFAGVKLEDGRELAARLGIRCVPSVQIYNGALGKVDEFPCGPGSVPRFRDTVQELSGACGDQCWEDGAVGGEGV